MTPSLDNSLTLVQPGRTSEIDYKTFGDPERHLIIRNRRVAEGFRQVAMEEAAIRKFRVGGPTASSEVEFFVFDLEHDEVLRKKLQQKYNDTFQGVLDQARYEVSKEADLTDGPYASLDDLEDLIALRRFLTNAITLSRKKRGKAALLFHHMTD